MGSAPLILTFTLDDASQQFFDALREKYFPPERNFLRAHCTLFHALPALHEGRIQADLRSIAKDFSPFGLDVAPPKFIGRGVAYGLEGKEAPAIHARLQKAWWDWLTPQDRQRLWPHITVQNKVTPDKARATHALLLETFSPRKSRVIGLQLWRYLGGPWREVEAFPFSASEEN